MEESTKTDLGATANAIPSTASSATPNAAPIPANTGLPAKEELPIKTDPGFLESAFIAPAQAASDAPMPQTAVPSGSEISFSKLPDPAPNSSSVPSSNFSGPIPSQAIADKAFPPVNTTMPGTTSNPPTLEQTGATSIYPSAAAGTGQLVGAPLILHSESPDGVKGLNFGAFYFSWIWGIANKVWSSLLVFIPVVGIVMIFVLLFKGNEWAWQKRKFESVDQFKKVQRIWSYWALGFLIAGFAISFLLFNLFGPKITDLISNKLPSNISSQIPSGL